MQRISTEHEDAIHEWASAVLTGMAVIWGSEDGKRPSPSFATLNIISGPTPIGKADEEYVEEDTYTYTIRKVFTLSVQTYGPDALIRCNDIVDSLMLPTKLALLQDAGFGVWGNSEPIDITEFMDTKHEGRAVVDIILAYAVQITDAPGEIQYVGIEGEINDHEIVIGNEPTP